MHHAYRRNFFSRWLFSHEPSSKPEAPPVQQFIGEAKSGATHVLLNFTLPLRIHKRTEIRSDLKKEKSKTERRGCRHNKREKLWNYRSNRKWLSSSRQASSRWQSAPWPRGVAEAQPAVQTGTARWIIPGWATWALRACKAPSSVAQLRKMREPNSQTQTRMKRPSGRRAKRKAARH